MSYLALFFLGLVQGLTEFLPVSSSGHLVLFSNILGIEESLFISILLHVATFLSICVVYHKDIIKMLLHPFSKESMQIVFATIPTCVIVIILMPIIKLSFAGRLLPICFFISAILLFAAETISKRKNKSFSNKTAFIMGVAQGFAVFPGISRSGTTISAALLCGNKTEATKFSFLMSLPIIFLSMLMEITEIFCGQQQISISLGPAILSFATAFVVGIFAIKLMNRLTEKTSLKWFSAYLIFIGILSFFVIS